MMTNDLQNHGRLSLQSAEIVRPRLHNFLHRQDGRRSVIERSEVTNLPVAQGKDMNPGRSQQTPGCIDAPIQIAYRYHFVAFDYELLRLEPLNVFHAVESYKVLFDLIMTVSRAGGRYKVGRTYGKPSHIFRKAVSQSVKVALPVSQIGIPHNIQIVVLTPRLTPS
jgi:hypothetical protein